MKRKLIIFTIMSFLFLNASPASGKLFKKLLCIKHGEKKQIKLEKKRALRKKPYRYIPDNFFEVEKNKLYRSKQLYHKNLDSYIKRFKIKTIINLRGENKQAPWWQKERTAALKNNVLFFNIPMSAKRFPYKKDLQTLLFLYKNAPKPILVHCKGGADRTGEACAIWLLEQQKKSKKEALKQLTLTYSHIKHWAPLKRKFIKKWA